MLLYFSFYLYLYVSVPPFSVPFFSSWFSLVSCFCYSIFLSPYLTVSLIFYLSLHISLALLTDCNSEEVDGGGGGGGGGGDRGGDVEEAEDLDPYDMAEAVDILKKLHKDMPDFQAKLVIIILLLFFQNPPFLLLSPLLLV